MIKKYFKKIKVDKVVIFFGLILVVGLLVKGWEYREEILPMSVQKFRNFGEKEQMNFLRKVAKKDGPVAAMEYLLKAYPKQPAAKHELGHVPGEEAFKTEEFSAFRICDSSFMFACYHGVTLQAIKENGYSQEVMRRLADGCLNLDENRTTTTACIHGVGHGIMWVKSYDFLSSLKECDLMFEDETDRFYCYDGVSMENVVRRGEERDLTGRDFDPENPRYPCNSIPQRYKAACVREHVQLARLIFYNRNTLDAATYCDGFTGEEVLNECYGSIGSALTQDYRDNPELIYAECNKLNGYETLCVSRSATQYAYAEDFKTAERMCGFLDEGSDRGSCNSSVEAAREAIKE